MGTVDIWRRILLAMVVLCVDPSVCQRPPETDYFLPFYDPTLDATYPLERQRDSLLQLDDEFYDVARAVSEDDLTAYRSHETIPDQILLHSDRRLSCVEFQSGVCVEDGDACCDTPSCSSLPKCSTRSGRKGSEPRTIRWVPGVGYLAPLESLESNISLAWLRLLNLWNLFLFPEEVDIFRHGNYSVANWDYLAVIRFPARRHAPDSYVEAGNSWGDSSPNGTKNNVTCASCYTTPDWGSWALDAVLQNVRASVRTLMIPSKPQNKVCFEKIASLHGILVRRAHHPEQLYTRPCIKRLTNTYHWGRLLFAEKKLRDLLFHQLGMPQPSRRIPEMGLEHPLDFEGRIVVYGRQEDSRKRWMVNVDEVVVAMRSYFSKAEVVHLRKLNGMSLREQAELFSQADVIVSPEGASLTNLIFMAPGSAILCAVPQATTTYEFATLNRQRTMTWLNIRYAHIACCSGSDLSVGLGNADAHLILDGEMAVRLLYSVLKKSEQESRAFQVFESACPRDDKINPAVFVQSPPHDLVPPLRL